MKGKIFTFFDGNGHKCGGCNWEGNYFYVFADTQEHAQEFYDKYGGLCAHCFVSYLAAHSRIQLSKEIEEIAPVKRGYTDE